MTAPRPNLALCLTARGVGAIAVVKLIGPGVGSFLATYFSKAARPGAAVHGELRDGDTVIDDPVVTLDTACESAEIHLHGGEYMTRATLDLAERAGFAVIDADHAPLPASAADGETTIEQEILAWAPAARTELAVRVLFAQQAAWAKLMTTYPELDRREPALRTPTESAADEARRMLADRSLVNLLQFPTVAIVGVPNVGKSTLANALFAAERSITADLPGTTRDWVGHEVDIGGLAIRLVDTPGVRESADAIEQAAIAHARPVIAAAAAVVVVLDPTQPTTDQRQLLDEHPAAIVVVNKSDRAAIEELDRTVVIRTIATTGVGVDELRDAVRRRFDCEGLVVDRARCWTERQRTLLQRIANGRG